MQPWEVDAVIRANTQRRKMHYDTARMTAYVVARAMGADISPDFIQFSWDKPSTPPPTAEEIAAMREEVKRFEDQLNKR